MLLCRFSVLYDQGGRVGGLGFAIYPKWRTITTGPKGPTRILYREIARENDTDLEAVYLLF
eukprot:COSAG05_NODE_9403_length_626_cov_1.726755_1_plen_61_part_10